MEHNLDNEQINRLWEHRLHEDEMFYNRLNFFLVFESVLLGVVGVLYSRPAPTKVILILISILGFLLTGIWGYVQARQKYVYDNLKALHQEIIPEYKMALERRGQARWPVSSTALLAYGVPLLFGVIWFMLLMFIAVN